MIPIPQYHWFSTKLEKAMSIFVIGGSSVPNSTNIFSNFGTMYWTMAQMLAHHASGGCNLRHGDLLGSGTVSGPAPGEQGCLLELARRGANPVALPNGETRSFLADGDEVFFRGWCARDGAARIGFGECRGEIRAAL